MLKQMKIQKNLLASPLFTISFHEILRETIFKI